MLRHLLTALALLAPIEAAPKSIWKKEIVETLPVTKGVKAQNLYAQIGPKKASAGGNETSFCGVVEPEMPSFCTCADAPYGGTLNCTVAIVAAGVTLDTVGVVLDLQPCALPMYFSFEATEEDLGVDYKYEITAGEEEDIPIPGVSVDVPGLGEAGLVMSVDIDGNIDALTMDLGLDACIDVYGFLTCASTVDPVDFPIWLLESTFDFSDVCTTAGSA